MRRSRPQTVQPAGVGDAPVVSPDKKKALVEACLSQPATETAQELVVVGRPDLWRRNNRWMIEAFDRKATCPRALTSSTGRSRRSSTTRGPSVGGRHSSGS